MSSFQRKRRETWCPGKGSLASASIMPGCGLRLALALAPMEEADDDDGAGVMPPPPPPPPPKVTLAVARKRRNSDIGGTILLFLFHLIIVGRRVGDWVLAAGMEHVAEAPVE